MSSSKPKMDAFLYYMSIHYGICYGPVEAVKEIVINDKTAWKGKLTDSESFSISKGDLFGGPKKEGGVGGTIDYLAGDALQVMPSYLASKMGLTPETCPGYRGITSFFFHNLSGGGFYWSANVPRVPAIKFKVARASPDLNDMHARIWREEVSNEYRTASNVDTNNTHSWRYFDVYNSTFVHRNTADNAIIIEDVRTGTVRASVSIAYTPVWIYISPSRNEVLAISTTGTFYAYDINTGALKQTLTGWDDGNLDGSSITQLCGTPDEYVVDGVTYLLFMIPGPSTADIVCLSNNGGGWAFRWYDVLTGIIGDGTSIMSMSATHFCVKQAAGHVLRVAWSVLGLGAGSTINFSSLLGWDVFGPDPINSFSYIPEHNVWFVASQHGKVATLNFACDAVVAVNEDNPDWGGHANEKPTRTRRILNADGNAVIIETPGDGETTIFFFDIMTCSLVNSIATSEWDPSLDISGLGRDTAFSVSENAIVTFDAYADALSRVFFMPRDVDFDSNVAHIIYEVTTDTDFSIGTPVSSIDVDSFEAAAATLYNEGFGISIEWKDQQTVEDFVSEMLTYIDGVIFVHPATGLLTLKLIRDDYDPDTLPTISPSNAKLLDFQRKLWADTINEINVSFTDPTSEEEENVTEQANANIAMQGGIVSDSNPYPGVRKRALATKLAKRDLRVAASPLASCQAVVNRTAWDVTPGSCVKVDWPDHGLSGVVMRVGTVDYGKIGDSTVRVSLMEDVFSLDIGDYDEVSDSAWEDLAEEPDPLTYVVPFTLPYYFGTQYVDAVTGDSLTEEDAILGVLGAQPGSDTSSFILAQETIDQFGNSTIEQGTVLSILARGTIVTALSFEVSSTVAVTGLTQGESPAVNMFAILGTTDEDMEICLISAVSGGNVTLLRGVLDTVPKAWDAGTPIWFVPRDAAIDDEFVHAVGETLAIRPLTVTSLGTLEWSTATGFTYEMLDRPWLPIRPANVKIEGQSIGLVNAVGETDVDVTWNNRNRLLEDSIVLDWDDATVTPEDGQTTKISVLKVSDRSLLTAHTGLTGTSFALPVASFSGQQSGIVRVESERDGLTSLQGHEIIVQVSSLTMDTDMFTMDTNTVTMDN